MTPASRIPSRAARAADVLSARFNGVASGNCRRNAASSFVVRIAAGASIAAAISNGADAQIYLPDTKPDVDQTTNVYFGSTKDTDGRFLSGVTASIKVDNATYLMVTDDAGRFKIRVPKNFPASRLKFSCSRPGYVLVRATKRPPPGNAPSPVQADCVLAPKPDAVK
jgi:hypothetical protein